MPKSKKYWERRKAENMWQYMESAEDCGDEIDLIYEDAMKYLIGEGNKIFTKVMDRYGLSDKEAKKILSKSKSLDLKDVKKEIRKGIPTEEKQKLLSEIESPAYAFRIKRFERMQDNIDGLMRDVYKREKKVSTRHYTDLAEESYNRNNFYIQQRLGVGFEVPQLNEKKIDRLLKSKWSGKNYSKRIWGNTQEVADKLKREMVLSLMTGKTNREVAETIQNEFGVSAYKARRLVRTESCFIANQTEIMSYEDSGIEKYEYCATLDLRTSPQCQKLDGKIFKVKDAQAGVNLPPMHPFCRSTTLAYFDDDIEEEVKAELGEAKETRRAYIPKENDSELIEDMSYEEWKKKYVVEDIDYENVKPGDTEKEYIKPKKKIKNNIEKSHPVQNNQNVSEKAENGIAKSSENDIIKLGSDAMDLENQRYGRNKNTLVNHTYIESGEYRKKFDKATNNNKVNKVLYDCAKKMLNHRSGTVFEDLYWIDEWGKVVTKELNNAEPRKVIYSEKTKQAISNANEYSLIAIHSHPSSMPPSIADFNACYTHKYKMGVIACHNGKIFAYTSEQEVSLNLYNMYIEEFADLGYDEYEAQIKTLEKLKINHDIDFWEVK